MSKKIIMIIALGWLVFFPGVVLAVDASSEIPELNPLCWKEEDCKSIRSKNFGVDAGDGWLKGETPCNQAGWGKCLPAGKTKTQISFGGRAEFANVGEFILVMYKYLLAIAGILAVIVIIASGVQWTASGGNSEVISNAKKRIGGALIGLFIGYMSYFILSTINPALVNLRLPQVFLIKPQSLMPEFCADIEGAKKGTINFLYAADAGRQTDKITPTQTLTGEKDFSHDYSRAPESFSCGNRYFAENGGSASCFGDWCAPPEAEARTTMCVPKLDNMRTCAPANVTGRIAAASFARKTGSALPGGTLLVDILSEEWSMPAVLSVKIASLCKAPVIDFEKIKNAAFQETLAQGLEWGGLFAAGPAVDLLKQSGKYFDFASLGYGNLHGTGSVSAGKDEQTYTASVSGGSSEIEILNAMEKCEKSGGLKGFALMVQMNETGDTGEYHFIGKGGVDLGDKVKIIPVGFFDKNYTKINDSYFIQPSELKKGIRIDIDPTQIKDIDEDADENIYYQSFGISR